MANWRLPENVLNFKLAIWLLAGEMAVGTLGYMWMEGYDLVEALYMVVITISTVGFTEVEPLSPGGRLFTSLFILLNIGIFAYILAVFSYYIIEGNFFKTWFIRRMQNTINSLNQHVVLCGYGKYGKEVAQNLLRHGIPFVVIDSDTEKIERLQHDESAMLFIDGDATQDEVLMAAGLQRAKAIISALADDSDNLYIVLTARQLNPRLNIISRASEPRAGKKLVKAGADHVVMPEQIGGFYMSTLVTKPGAVEFFSFITNESQSDIGFEEIAFEDLPSAMRDAPIADLHLRRETGVNIIGYRDERGAYFVNPPPDTTLRPGGSFIVLGSDDQLKKLHALLAEEEEKTGTGK